MKLVPYQWKLVAVAVASMAALAGCGSGGDSAPPPPLPDLNALPAGIVNITGPATYDGSADDLLTAGLGKTGLAGTAPGVADASNPTAAELRRRAIYTNYRGVLDITAAGGYGTLYGPSVTFFLPVPSSA